MIEFSRVAFPLIPQGWKIYAFIKKLKLSNDICLRELQKTKDKSERRLAEKSALVIGYVERREKIPQSIIILYEAAFEQCASAWDRLSEHILAKFLNSELVRERYFQSLINLIENHKDAFGTGTPYKNARRLYERWWPSISTKAY
jgi:hypothetical protein